MALDVDILEGFGRSDLPLDQARDQYMHGASVTRFDENLVSAGIQEVDGESFFIKALGCFNPKRNF